VPNVTLQVAVHLQVAEDERLRIGGTFERDPRALANAAVGAVTADQVASMQPLRPLVPVTQGADDIVLAGLELDELDAPLDVDPCSARCSFKTASVSAWEMKSRNG
jgi:hypothetical protein